MPWEAWLTLLVVAGMLALLVRGFAADLVTVAALAVLMGVAVTVPRSRLPSPNDLLRGFGNEGLLTVAALFVVAGGLTRTGALHRISEQVLGRSGGIRSALIRLMLPTGALSAFLNNTPIVAMLIPVVEQWSKRSALPRSQLYLPLSYAAILGGTCTLIGTSTNLVVHGLLLETGHSGLGLFELAWVGVPAALIGMSYVVLLAPRLLPARRDEPLGGDPREFTVELVVETRGPLVGRSVEQAGLRHLPGLFLVEIERDGRVLPAVGPDEVLGAGDRLLFAGAVDSVADLRRLVPGLSPPTGQRSAWATTVTERHLFRVVVSDACPLIGRTIREGRFRTVYDAAVIAVARRGERLTGKVGDLIVQPGDALLLEAHALWSARQQGAADFWIVDAVKGAAPPRRRRAWAAWVAFALMLVGALMGLPLVATSLLAAVGMIGARCLTTYEARRFVEWPVLVVIGATLGIGRALETSGCAGTLAGLLVDHATHSPRLALVAVYFATMLLTEVITNNAAAALMFPLAHQLATRLGLDPTPFAVAIMFAASASFSTPIGYQTNLMVSGPGGYRISDYLRLGVPLNLLLLGTTTTLIPLVWPLSAGR